MASSSSSMWMYRHLVHHCCQLSHEACSRVVPFLWRWISVWPPPPFTTNNATTSILMLVSLSSWGRTYLGQVPVTGITDNYPTRIQPESFPPYQCALPTDSISPQVCQHLGSSTFLMKIVSHGCFREHFSDFEQSMSIFSDFLSVRISPYLSAIWKNPSVNQWFTFFD